MGSKKKQTVGYRYYFGIHMGFGRGPLDELVEIKVGDRTAWQGSVTENKSILIDSPDLFGGDKGEGGIQGIMDVMMGQSGQPVNGRLATILQGIMPAFRGVTTAFYDGLICSLNPYPKKWTARWRRALKGWDGEAWYPAKAMIPLEGGAIKAMNPAHILFECRTNRDWGRGIDRHQLDTSSYQQAADALYNEGFGLCLKWSRQESLDNFEQIVLDHIGATQFLSRTTGLWTLRLIRGDYDVAALPLFDEDSGLLGIDEDTVASADTETNEIVVVWHDPLTNQDRMVREKNVGAVRAAGGVISTTRQYPGLPSASLAGRVALRDVQTCTSGVRRLKLRLDRRAYRLEPAMPFRIRSRARGIEQLVVRAGSIDYGTLTEGTVTVTALVDVFGLPASATTAIQPPYWAPPDQTARLMTSRRLIEIPYRELAANLTAPELGALQPESGHVGSLGRRPTPLSLNYRLLTRTGSRAFEEKTVGDFCPMAKLGAAIPLGADRIEAVLSESSDLEQIETGSAVLIDEEIFRLDTLNLQTGTATLSRGCIDTVPAAHESGATVWFYEDWLATDKQEYVTGERVDAKLLTCTGREVLAENAASQDSLRLTQRQTRPYPPGQFRIDNHYYPETVEDSFQVSWAHRDRVLQADQLLDTQQGNIGPEAGTTYNLRILRADNNSLLEQQKDLTATASTPVTLAYAGDVIAELSAVRDGIVSHQTHRHRFHYTPPAAKTVLKLDMEGENAATEVTDSLGHIMTTIGEAHLDAGTFRIGCASLALDGNGDWLETPGTQEFMFKTGDFTVECWFNSSKTRYQALVDFYLSGQTGWQMAIDGSGRLNWYGKSLIATGTTSLYDGTWHHVAAARENNLLRLFIDGVLQASKTDSTDYRTQSAKLAIGAQVTSRSSSYDFAGYIDEVRIVKGRAMYTEDFAVPDEPLPVEID